MKHSSTHRARIRRGLALCAVGALVVGLTAACGSDDDGGGSSDGPVKLTIATFNEFGYEDLIEEWNAANPDIQVEQKKVGTWDDAKDNLFTKLAAGSGLSDIEAIEGDGMPAILAESDAFVDLTDSELDGRWLDWKAAAGTDADGRMIGYGTDSGPEGICYRADLFEKAGLPTDREEVAALFGTWDDYFAVGEEFVAKRCPTPRGTTRPAASPRRCSTRSSSPSRRRTARSTSRTPSSRRCGRPSPPTPTRACRPG